MGGAPTIRRSEFALRAATEQDLEDITRVHVEGFTEEPYVHYCFPLRDEYLEDYWEWTKREYLDYLQQPEKYLMHVLKSGTDDAAAAKPVGVAVWNLAVLSNATGGTQTLCSDCLAPHVLLTPLTDPGLDQRRDINQKRLETFLEKAGRRFKTYFAK